MAHKKNITTSTSPVFLQSVYVYGSYRKIKTGVSFFWTTRYTT